MSAALKIEPAACVAPIGDGLELCGRPATELRIVEGVLVRLCDTHARELDREVAN